MFKVACVLAALKEIEEQHYLNSTSLGTLGAFTLASDSQTQH